MSTKRKKIYNKTDILSAERELKLINKKLNKYKKRKTIQIRISEKWYRKIKEEVTSEKITMSSFLDQICKYFFSNYN